jgi:hypothetical protein
MSRPDLQVLRTFVAVPGKEGRAETLLKSRASTRPHVARRGPFRRAGPSMVLFRRHPNDERSSRRAFEGSYVVPLFRDLFDRIHGCESHSLYGHGLVPWLEAHQQDTDWLRAVAARTESGVLPPVMMRCAISMRCRA